MHGEHEAAPSLEERPRGQRMGMAAPPAHEEPAGHRVEEPVAVATSQKEPGAAVQGEHEDSPSAEDVPGWHCIAS